MLSFAALVLVLVFIMLWAGFWQLDRAKQKVAWQQQYEQAYQQPAKMLSGKLPEPEKLRFSSVIVAGRYLNEQQFLLDNRINGETEADKRVGFDVITPLLTDAGEVVLVNRGWLPANLSRQDLPEVAIAQGEVLLSGIMHIPGQGYRLGAMDADLHWPRVIQFIDYAVIAERLGKPVYPALLMLSQTQTNGYLRNWRPVLEGPAKHYSYAVQWFLMALASIVLFGFFCRQQRKQSNDE